MKLLRSLEYVFENSVKVLRSRKELFFGFGSTANDDTGSVLKLSTIEDKSILTNTPIHNLAEERNVGMLNYELNLRGRNQFKTSSQNLVVNKSTDFIRDDFQHLRKFTKYQQKRLKMLNKNGAVKWRK